MTGDALLAVLDGAKIQNLQLTMRKFKEQGIFELMAPLRALGMENAFTEAAARFFTRPSSP